MRRRDFLRLLGGTAAAWPVVARAQQTALPVIGFMGSESPDLYADRLRAFRQGLKETGFVEGQNVAVEFRWAQGQYDRYPEFAAELVRRQVAVIAATGGEPSPQSAKAATQTIPIVFTANGDPVSSGLVASLNRPGGNVTGITIFGDVTVAKRLQLMHELIPQAAIAYLINPNNPNGDTEMRAAQTAARSFGKEVLVLRASNESELDTAFATMAQQQVGALVVGSDPFFYWRRDQVASLAARHAIPAKLPTWVRSGWRSDGIRKQPHGHVSPRRRLCRPDSQRREARRLANCTVVQVRPSDQSQDRQNAGRHCAIWPTERCR